ILRMSLEDALAELQGTVGTELKMWSWGDLHQVTFKHILGSKEPLDKIFNVGPFPAGGAGTTLNSGEYNLNSPFQMTVGPSFRHITDFSDSVSSLMVITSGQSGQPLHPHYDDFAPLWLNGLYHRMILDVPMVRGQNEWKHLVLRPEK
ncbi:MAG: penicillin acylase family protein, partial [Bacteroidota bacterium]